MKKFMKALAFATVMCMLLSTAAFADVNQPTLEEDYELTVTVTADGTEQVALLVLKAGTALADASSSNVYFVGQDAADDGRATFDVVLNPATLGEEKKVDIYAGYASNTGNAVSVTGVSVVEDQELTINLADMVVIPDVEAYVADGKVDGEINADVPKREVATMVLAKVNFANVGTTNVIDKAGWIFNTDDGKRYVHYDLTGFGVFEGDVQIGVTFANGWKDSFKDKEGYRAPLTFDEDDVELYLRVNNVETPVVEAENN